MDGRWLALGTIGALAVAGARRRGSGARKRYWISDIVEMRGHEAEMDLDNFPAFTNFSTGDGCRSSWAMPSWETAEAWVEHLKGRDYVRVSADLEPSRSSEGVSGVRFLLPSGELALDLKLQRTLAGLILSSRWGERFRIEAHGLDSKTQLRLQSIELRRRHGILATGGYLGPGHLTALHEMIKPLCNLDLDDFGNEASEPLTELAWLINHPYEGY